MKLYVYTHSHVHEYLHGFTYMGIQKQQTEQIYMVKWLLLNAINYYYINTVGYYIVPLSDFDVPSITDLVVRQLVYLILPSGLCTFSLPLSLRNYQCP